MNGPFNLCPLTSDHPGAMALGKEPILDGEKVLGYGTNANCGYNTGKLILYGYSPIEYTREGTPIEVEYFGKCF